MTARIYTAAEALALLDGFVANAQTVSDLAASVAFHDRRAEKAEAELIEAHDRARDAESERAAAEAALTAVWQAITYDDLPRLPGGDGLVVDAEAVGQRVAAAFSSTVRGVLDAVGARDRKVPPLPFASLVAWLATETRLVVDDLAMTRDNHHARTTMAEAEVARLTVALTAQTARADGAEAEALRLARERDALRAIVDGRTTPPTIEEAQSHIDAGGSFRVVSVNGSAYSAGSVLAVDLAVEDFRGARWWALDAEGRPCAWPVVTEVTP